MQFVAHALRIPTWVRLQVRNYSGRTFSGGGSSMANVAVQLPRSALIAAQTRVLFNASWALADLQCYVPVCKTTCEGMPKLGEGICI